jgi:large subunit ribosomal protein L17
MRKRQKGRKLSLKRDQRKALLRSLAEALLTKEKIQTTLAKAKEVSIFAEKMITIAKKKGLIAERDLAKSFSDRLVKKMTKEIGPRFAQRQGGYTRIMKLPPRKDDGAKMAIIELVK